MRAVQPVNELTERVAAELRSARGRADISKARVVRDAGTSKERTYGIFEGKISPTVAELYAICKVLGVSVSEVIVSANR